MAFFAIRSFAAAALAASGAACSGDDGASGATGDAASGQQVYENPVEDGNTFACATCHALNEPAADGLRRPGHPIGDAYARPSFKNGQLTELREAVNSCLQEWMNAEPWGADDNRWTSLESFLSGQAPPTAPALTYEIVQPSADLSGGDAAAGRATFNSSCAVCHGHDGVGSAQAPPVAMRGLEPSYSARRIRTSGLGDSAIYDELTGGIMPFWSADRVSDPEVRDLVAWLALGGGGGTSSGTGGATSGTTGGATSGSDGTSGGTSAGTGTDPTDSGGATTGSGCDSTHAKVGWVADLSMEFHNVGGQAEIVDDCTVVISNFTYDGTGIDVRVYGGLGGDYDNGFAMTEDLLREGGYNGEYLVASLPDGHTFDDLDGVSVWCVDVGVSFGHGTFAPP